MAGKRAPGGGRKPKGPFKGKSATITTRVTPATRLALEREMKKSGRSLSQEIEHRLDESVRKNRESPLHVRALAHTVGLLASAVERDTGERWIDNAFTGLAVRSAIDGLLSSFAPAPDGPLAVPAKLNVAASRMPSVRNSMLDPELLGQLKAGVVITQIENADSPDPEGFWQVLRDLGSGWKRNQSIWNKETKR